MNYFLQQDFDRLNLKITEICDKIKQIDQEMGESCREGAETFHDNFAYEDGERQQALLGGRLRQYISVRNNARIVKEEPQMNMVTIGKTVQLVDENNQPHTYRIGSYLTFEDDDVTISYNSPLARLIIGAKVGEKRSGSVGHSKKTFTISSVS